MKNQVIKIALLLCLFSMLMLAQNKSSQEMADTAKNKSNAKKSINGVTAAGDVINFKNSTGNSIITITDEGSNVGSITLSSGSAPSTTTNKLYNVGGVLKFNGSDIGAGSGSSGGWTDLGTKIHNTTLTDKVGIGTNNPLSNLSVGGDGTNSAAIYGTASGDNDHALHGEVTGPSGIGVFGKATDTGSNNYGGYFDAAGTSGRGVYGVASYSGSGSITYGGYFVSNSIQGTGVFGFGNQNGLVGQTDYGLNARGVYGLATATGTGVTSYGGYFEAKGGRGTGVYGLASDNGVGKNYGGYFEAKGDSGIGVYAYTEGNISNAIYGEALDGTAIYGEALNGTAIHGFSWASDGIGVHGEAPASGTSSISYGGKFRSGGQTGIGVYGEATYSAGTTTNYGGKFIASGYNGGGISAEATGYAGRGVFGLASNTGSGENYGGYFKAKGTTGKGVYGIATGTSGVGVYGDAANGAKAGYFNGNVTVTGTLSKGGGSFKIDHPVDPQNKYLYHSFVESPDMMNVYNGNVVLNENGEAIVNLPDWFEALNMDFRYQLTCIGGFAKVYISEEISGNQFKIAGGTPNIKVSWQVTGIRHDAFANKHRIPIEEEKAIKDRGKYLHPDAFNISKSAGVNFNKKN